MRKLKAAASFAALGVILAATGACSKKPADTTAEQAPAATAAPVPAETAAAAPVEAVAYSSLTGDAAAGEKIFIQCKACHVIDPGVNRVGPSLHAVVGRKAGTIEGFHYSPANKNSGIVWSDEELFKYLEAPQKVVPGTYMTFPGLKKPQDRADVIAYLKANS